MTAIAGKVRWRSTYAHKAQRTRSQSKHEIRTVIAQGHVVRVLTRCKLIAFSDISSLPLGADAVIPELKE